MDFWFGLAQLIGIHTILGLSAYVILQTGQVSIAQAGFFAVGAYIAGMLTVLAGWHIIPAILAASVGSAILATIVGFPILRVKGLMFVVATLALGEAVRLFWFNFDYQIAKGGVVIGPEGGEGFKQIRFFPENGWTTGDVAVFVWIIVIIVMAALWWMDRSRAGAVLRAVGEDDLAAQSVGVNLTVVKVTAFAIGGLIAGIGGALYAHYTTHIEHSNFNILLATFAIAYPILGGLSNVFGTLVAVVFIQGFLVEALRFLGDWRNLLFGLLILLVMNVRPRGMTDFYRDLSLSGRIRLWLLAALALALTVIGEFYGRTIVGTVVPALGVGKLAYVEMAWLVFALAVLVLCWQALIRLAVAAWRLAMEQGSTAMVRLGKKAT